MDTRPIVDFLGIGVYRSGSTWLAECLRQHPQVDFPNASEGGFELTTMKQSKELDYFTLGQRLDSEDNPRTTHDKGPEWYESQFPPRRDGVLRGEFSPSYLVGEKSAGLIRQAVPDVRLIVALRNPAEAVTSFFRLRKLGGLKENLEEAWAKGYFRVIGQYATELKRYLQLFPKEQIHVVLFEDIKEKPAEAAAGLYRHLGIDDTFKPDCLETRINASRQEKAPGVRRLASQAAAAASKATGGRSDKLLHNRATFRLWRRFFTVSGKKTEAKTGVAQEMRDYFRPEVEELERIIGRNLSG